MTFSADLPRRLARWAALGLAPLTLAVAAQAQPVVQPLPDPAQTRLSEALRMLAQDPRSLTGLLAAGQASLALDDVEAAQRFFRRAEEVAPAHGGVKAGLASVLVRERKPREALQLFAQAEAAGEPMAAHAGERGLAHDLIGDNVQAQRDYRLALSLGDSPLITRRLAISQAIAGDQRGSEATLLPLLQRRDLAAYRARAFSLAILGKAEEAVSIAETMLPERLSSRMAPYLRYMPHLSRAQKAAAANLGVFPTAAEIGREDPALAAAATQAAPAPSAPGPDARLVPSGEPLGQREGVIVAAATPSTAQIAGAATPSPAPAPAVTASAPAPAPAAPSAAVPQSPPALSLSEAFANFSLQSPKPVPLEGAVDITAIEPVRETRITPTAATAEPAPPPAPVHPSRQWVQVATGRDVSALAFDWRRIKRGAGGLLDKTQPHVVAWGQTRRLVAGPYASAREAQDLVAKLKEKQIDSFRFASSQGEEVKPLE